MRVHVHREPRPARRANALVEHDPVARPGDRRDDLGDRLPIGPAVLPVRRALLDVGGSREADDDDDGGGPHPPARERGDGDRDQHRRGRCAEREVARRVSERGDPCDDQERDCRHRGPHAAEQQQAAVSGCRVLATTASEGDRDPHDDERPRHEGDGLEHEPLPNEHGLGRDLPRWTGERDLVALQHGDHADRGGEQGCARPGEQERTEAAVVRPPRPSELDGDDDRVHRDEQCDVQEQVAREREPDRVDPPPEPAHRFVEQAQREQGEPDRRCGREPERPGLGRQECDARQRDEDDGGDHRRFARREPSHEQVEAGGCHADRDPRRQAHRERRGPGDRDPEVQQRVVGAVHRVDGAEERPER